MNQQLTYSVVFPLVHRLWNNISQGGLATAFDLAAFRLSMIAPVKKSVNHSRTVASMRETGCEQRQHQKFVFAEIRRCKVNSLLVLLVICFLCCNRFFSAVMWVLRFPFFWSCVCHFTCGLLR